MLAGFIASPLVIAQEETDIWAALSTPGAVVVIRHSYAPRSIIPGSSENSECANERNLDADGRAQAKAIGESFRDQGIEVGDVLSSPTCRTRDTGLLAFSHVENWDELRGAVGDPALARERVEKIQARMRQHDGDKPLVLITHGSIVRALLGHSMEMGRLAVLVPESEGDAYREVGSLFVSGG